MPSQIAISNVLVDLNLAVWYRITICIYASKKFWRILIWRLLRQSAKLPNLIPRQIFQLYSIGCALAMEVITITGSKGSARQCLHCPCACARGEVCCCRPHEKIIRSKHLGIIASDQHCHNVKNRKKNWRIFIPKHLIGPINATDCAFCLATPLDNT